MAMISEIEAAPAVQESASRKSEWLLFPSGLVSQNRQIERGLAALIWVAMPFLFHLFYTRPGGFGDLIERSPLYFFLTVVYVIAVVVVTYLALWALTRMVQAETPDAARSKRKITLRAWMDAVISCFALTAIILSASTWISMQWLQNPDTRVTIDAVSRMFSLNEGNRWIHLVGYGYALIAALAIGFIVRRLTRSEASAVVGRAGMLSQARDPLVFLVALVAYLVLIVSMWLTELPIPWLS